MAKSKNNLIWIDLEMTGLDTNNDYIIEIATIVTDAHLNVLAEGPILAIHQDDAILDGMDEWNTRQHGKSAYRPQKRPGRGGENMVVVVFCMGHGCGSLTFVQSGR